MNLYKKRIANSFIIIALICYIILPPLTVTGAETQGDVPMIIKAQMINNRDMELYWNRDVTDADNEEYYSITVNGKENKIYSYSWGSYYTEKGIVYYNPKSSMNPDGADAPKTSIRLSDPISDPNNLPDIKVNITGNKIKDKSGNYAPVQTVTVDTYDPFYQQEIVLDCGVRILGTKNVMPDAMTKAEEMLEVILANEQIATRMGNAGCMLGIYGNGEIAYDIPEHRFDYEEAYLYVEGFGGTQLASIKDTNVLRITTGTHRTGYPNESILTHEFAHTVKNYGFSNSQAREWNNIYSTAINNGLWPNSYAGSNADEYFATLSAMWFNVMDDTWNGRWDGVRGPINTRNELKVYDYAAYEFLSRIYVSDRYLPYPWENGSVPNNYVYPGSEEPDPTPTPSPTPKPTASPTPKPTPSPTPTPTATPTPTPTPTVSPTPTPTASPTPTPTASPTPTPTASPTPTPTASPTPTPTTSPTPTPTASPTPTPTASPMPTPTVSPMPSPTASPTPTPTANLIPKPTKEPVTWDKLKLAKKTVIKSIKQKKGRKVRVVIKKIKGADGYLIRYSKNKKFKKPVKKRVVKTPKCIIKNLKKGKYYFKAVSIVKDENGNRKYGEVSVTKKITIR